MQMFFCLAIFCLGAGCRTGTPPVNSLEDAFSIKIECRNEKGLEESILMELRAGRAKDIVVSRLGEELDIQAAFRAIDTSPAKVSAIGDRVQQFSGIFFVTIEKDHSVVRQLN